MKAIIVIQMDNAAFDFDEGTGTELARVLRRLADQVDDENPDEGDTYTARDTNGNTVAEMEITEDMLTV